MKNAKIVFLDRDGTLNIDAGYTCRPENIIPYDFAAEALASIQQNGFRTVVVTNQSAIGRGIATVEDVEATNNALRDSLLREAPEAQIDYFCYCPHHPEDSCGCRKPLTGMVKKPDFPWAFQGESCWMIGDKLSDIEFGLALGLPAAHCILVLTGDGRREQEKLRELGSLRLNDIQISENVLQAALHIQKNSKTNS